MESGHIEAVLYDKNTDEIVNKIPDTDFIGYINRWPNDGNREVTESKYKDDKSVRVVDLALPEEAVRDFIGNAQNFLPSKRDQVHTNLGISNKNDLPISAGSNPRRYDFLESNCATGICIGLNMDPDSPVNQTGGITDPNEVMDNILTTFSNYYDAEEDVKGDRTSRREGITKLVTERLGIKPNSRVLSIAVDYLDGLGRNELTDALEDLSKKPIIQRLAKGESFMSPLGVAQTASEISDAFGELPDGTMSALLGMAWEQGPNAYIRENTPFDFSSEGVDNIVPWWQRNVISPVGDALEDAGKSVSNFFGFQEGGGIYNIGKEYNPFLSHGGEKGHSPKSIIEVDKDVEIPYDESLQYNFKPKLDKTKFSINTDFKKKFGTKFHTVLPTDTQIDFKTTLPLNIFSSVLPFDLPDYNKSKIDLSLKQPISDDTSIGFDINAAIRDGKTQLTPQLTFKHSFKKGGSVSWMWKGKKYYGTLIPSMEDEKNRYARTKNGKIKKLPKKQKGGTVSELWEEVTGTPWSQAKAQGLTDGGYAANIALRNKLISTPSEFKQKPSNTLPPANTNSNAANATLSPEEINDKINRAKDFNAAFGIARDYYGANKIFEYNGKQFGTNLAGETFEPSEEDMVAAGLKPKQREKIYKQNRSVVSPYTDDNIVEFDEYEDFENIKKNNANLNRMDQADLIVSYQLANAKKPYLIVDEQMGRMHLYYPGEEKPRESYPIISGKNEGDAQTVTKADYFYKGEKLDQQGLNDAMTATGASSVDALIDMPGYSAETNWKAGNKTTGAGKFTIGQVNEDSGFFDESGQNRKTPSFVLKNEDGNEVSTVIHTVPNAQSAERINALTSQDPKNLRLTNGCINGLCTDLIDMHNIHDIGEGSEIFILPEDQGNKFVYENGKLNFRTTFQNRVDAESYVDSEGNVQRGQGINRSRNTLNYRPIKIDIDKESFENDKFTYFDFDDEQEYNTVVVPFVKSLEDNKQKIMKTMQVTGDVYNDIAKISLGILGNETNFGDTHSEFGNILRGASKVMNEARSSSPDYQFKYQPSIQLGNEKVPVTGGLVPERFTGAKSDDNSVGLTQFRWKWVEKDPELKKRLKTLGITSNVDFMDAEKAALGTAAVLAYYYNNRKVDDIYRDLPKHWAGSIKRDPDRKVYADNVMNNIKYFTLKEKTTFQGGGAVGQDILLRQAYAESTFRPKVTSKANAKGLTQIRPNVLSDYKKANNIEGDVDLTNVSDAVDVQKWYMNDLYNASFIDKENQSEDVRLAKTLAAYNWGRGNLLNFLNEEKESSDIYKSLDWVEKLPNETKTYINKILGNNDQFNKDYNKAVNNEKYTYIVNEYKSIGGEISDLKIYKDYVNGLYDGKPNLKKAERIYDKLNRVYYYKAGQVGMSAPNYIMSYLD